MLSLRFSPEVFTLIRKAAAEEGLGVGTYLVRLIEKHVKSKKGRNNEEEETK